MKVRLSLLASTDLSNILLYTEQHWGRHQRQRYGTKMRETFVTIAENPRIGSRSESSASELRKISVDEHIVFYRLHDDFVEIVRILHYRIDASRLFGE